MTAKLLIVDDDIGTIHQMNSVLRGVGDLFFSTSGLAAIRAAQEKRPDIVLLDAEMPGMNGFDVCAALKADPETASARVIFVTARSDIPSEMRALELGAIDFIHKPISPPSVVARVRNHIIMKAQADELARLASIDSLTGLPNRRALDIALNLEVHRAYRNKFSVAILMVDIDYFKEYNDCYGHQRGDECLQMIAKVLKSCIQRPGEIAARYGGEEFVIILPETDIVGGIGFAEVVCEAVRALKIRHEKSNLGGIVTVSVGIAANVPNDDAEASSLVSAADQSLYEAKGAGRNQVAWKRV